MKKQKLYLRIIFLILGLSVYFVISSFKLDAIPGEWFGDISIVHDYLTNILSGSWPLYFEAGGGPAYHYLIVPMAAVIGDHFIQLKILAVITGGVGLISIYFLAKSVFDVKTSLMSAAIAGISFWLFVWGRTGNYNIFVVFLSAASGFLAIKYIKFPKTEYLLAGALIASIGLLTYAGTFLLPLVFLLQVAIGLFIKKKRKLLLKSFLSIVIYFIPAIFIFSTIVARDPAPFTTGYIGSKLFTKDKLTIKEAIRKTETNIIKTLLMFNLRGDGTFRYNVPNSPQLDGVSGIFLLWGLYLFFFGKKKREEKIAFLIPLIIFPIPSVLPTILPGEVPNSLRTLGTLPYIMVLVSYGVVSFFRSYKKLGLAFLAIFILAVFLNIYKYFVLYPKYLPNKNTPFGKIISKRIDQLPADYKVVIDGCCWGDWGQPEPKGILAELRKKRPVAFFSAHDHPAEFNCRDVTSDWYGKTIYFIIDPRKWQGKNPIKPCLRGGEEDVIFTDGYTVARIYKVKVLSN